MLYPTFLTAILLLRPMALAQLTKANLPDCTLACMQRLQSLNTVTTCDVNDLSCFCHDDVAKSAISKCVNTSCGMDDQVSTADKTNDLCSDISRGPPYLRPRDTNTQFGGGGGGAGGRNGPGPGNGPGNGLVSGPGSGSVNGSGIGGGGGGLSGFSGNGGQGRPAGGNRGGFENKGGPPGSGLGSIGGAFGGEGSGSLPIPDPVTVTSQADPVTITTQAPAPAASTVTSIIQQTVVLTSSILSVTTSILTESPLPESTVVPSSDEEVTQSTIESDASVTTSSTPSSTDVSLVSMTSSTELSPSSQEVSISTSAPVPDASSTSSVLQPSTIPFSALSAAPTIEQSPPTRQKPSISPGVIAGSVTGIVLALVILTAVGFLFFRRRTQRLDREFAELKAEHGEKATAGSEVSPSGGSTKWSGRPKRRTILDIPEDFDFGFKRMTSYMVPKTGVKRESRVSS